MRKQYLASALFGALAFLLDFGLVDAIAGTDSTFGTATTGPLGIATTWMTGSLGKIIALCALAVGIGIGVYKQSIMAIAVGMGFALAASAGPSILSGIFSAVL